ncbi:INO80 complex subunit C [Nematocida homosporus]|uniref:INO80 complex subunit C n=1 Tax=Nematocida homosporus TaxID=1912981 RepID=UPI00221E7A39|nr:INO80 complex subunit C [Nematocida homosporus]KAI5187385.1 INO80 complex subunit C [Nematocida homosporus]
MKVSARPKSKTLKQVYNRLLVESPLFVSLFTRVSNRPTPELCDLTGLAAHYRCPRTGLQYHSAEVYERIREMSTDTAQRIGKLRHLGKEANIFGKTK